MREPGKDRDIEAMLSRLGEEFGASGSIAPDVQARLAGARMRSPRRNMFVGIAAAVLLVGVGFWLGRGSGTVQRNAAGDVRIHTQCVLDDAVLIEHLAAIVNKRAVLVIWSCRDGDHTEFEPGEAPAGEAPKYRQYVLAREKAGDGWNVVWSLFVATGDVSPALEPPAVRMRTSDGRLLIMSASPASNRARNSPMFSGQRAFPGGRVSAWRTSSG